MNTPSPLCPLHYRVHGEHMFRVFATMTPMDGANVDCPGNDVETTHNYGTHREVPISEATEERNGRWYILMGFAGYNSRANNGSGYVSRKAAENSIRYYSNRSK